MKCLKDKEFFWYTFNFNKPNLEDNLKESEKQLFYALIKEINHWSESTDVKVYITAEPFGQNLKYQIEQNLESKNSTCFSAIVYKGEIFAVILSSFKKSQPLKGYHSKIKLNNVYIDDIVVNPKHHNKGFGTKILQYFIKNLETITDFKEFDGIDSLITETNDKSKKIFSKSNFISLKKHPQNPLQHFYLPMNKEIENKIISADNINNQKDNDNLDK